MWVISCSLAAGGTENGENDSKKATEEELSFIKSSICEQWKKLGVCFHKKNCLRVKPKPLCLYYLAGIGFPSSRSISVSACVVYGTACVHRELYGQNTDRKKKLCK